MITPKIVPDALSYTIVDIIVDVLTASSKSEFESIKMGDTTIQTGSSSSNKTSVDDFINSRMDIIGVYMYTEVV